MNNFFSNNKLVIVGILVLVVAAAGLIWWQKTMPKSSEFGGRVTKVDGDSLVVNGQFDVPGRPELKTQESQQDVNIKVDKNTKITRELIYLPTSAELKLSGGYFDPRTARRESKIATIQDMASDAKAQTVSVAVKASGNVYGKSQFTATEITYTIAYDPEFFGNSQ